MLTDEPSHSGNNNFSPRTRKMGTKVIREPSAYAKMKESIRTQTKTIHKIIPARIDFTTFPKKMINRFFLKATKGIIHEGPILRLKR